MLQGWILASIVAIAVAITVIVGCKRYWAWALLSTLLMLLGLYALGATAAFIAVILLINAVSNPKPGAVIEHDADHHTHTDTRE